MLAGLKVKRLLLFSIVNKAVGIPDSSPLSLWMSTLGEDTTERGDRGWKEAQREGENRVTLRITLWCVWGVLFLLYCVCGVFFLAPSTLMLPGDVSERLAIMVSKVVRGGLLETSGVVRKPSLFGPPLWMLVSMWKFSLFQSKFPIQLSHCGLWLWWTGTPHGNWARDNLHMWACCVNSVTGFVLGKAQGHGLYWNKGPMREGWGWEQIQESPAPSVFAWRKNHHKVS